MSILTMTATKLAYANPATGSKWIEGAAMQGTYGSSGAPRAGAMLFSTLRPVDWSAQSISRIRLALSFGGAGYNREKTIGLYGGARSALSGTGTSMLGAAIGSVPTGASAYNGDAKIVFSPSVNAAAFENFVDFLRSGTQNALAVYVSETTNQSYSANYLQITAASVEVTYEPAGSAGALDRTSVAVGETISLTIVPSAEDAVHKVRWTLDDLSQTQQLAAGEVLASLTVPSNWLAAFPSAPSARASCTLETWRGDAGLLSAHLRRDDLHFRCGFARRRRDRRLSNQRRRRRGERSGDVHHARICSLRHDDVYRRRDRCARHVREQDDFHRGCAAGAVDDQNVSRVPLLRRAGRYGDV